MDCRLLLLVMVILLEGRKPLPPSDYVKGFGSWEEYSTEFFPEDAAEDV